MIKILDNLVKIFIIADLHINSTDPLVLWEELKIFFDKIAKEKPDIIVVAGDTMDSRVSMNHHAALVFNKFWEHLKYKTDAIIIALHGTFLHDHKQLNAIKHLADENFRIYEKVDVEFIDGMRFLIIPEEAVLDSDKYYKEYLKPDIPYDMCFGHGMFDHVGFSHHVDKSLGKRKLMVPIFNYEKHFEKIVHGSTIFGHIHTHSWYKNMAYTGSYSRDSHGQEEKKGFISLVYDKLNKKVVEKKFIENTKAPIFRSIKESELPKDKDILLSVLDREDKDSFKLRIILDRAIDEIRKSEINSFIRSRLNVTIKDEYNLKLRKKEKKKNTTIESDEVQKQLDKYRGVDWMDATIHWMKENKDVVISKEEINRTLNNDLI